MNIEFKYAQPVDLLKVVQTYNSTIESRMVTADTEIVSVDDKKKWFDSHSAEKRPLWLVIADGNYAGWMSFSSFYGRPAYDGTVELSIYLEEKYRQFGIGKKCLSKAIEVSPSLKIHTLLGFIFGHNTISLNLFYQFGFEKWAHLPEVANLDGIYRDLIILGKKVKFN